MTTLRSAPRREATSMLSMLRTRPRVVDGVLAGGLVLTGLLEGLLVPTGRPLLLHEMLTVLVMGSVAWRRRFPLGVLAFVVVGVIVLDPISQLSVFAALVIVAFTAGAELDPPRSQVALVLAIVPMWVSIAFQSGTVSDYLAMVVLYGGSWAMGQTLRERGRRSAELAERAERAERDREERARQAVVEERARIARELHDVVAHSISVVTVQTQAIRRRLDPGLRREIDDLRAVEETARQAMAEMRRLFGVLRADGERASLSPQPGLDQLDRLIQENADAGVPVSLTVEGRRPPLSPGLDLAAYRIVQEALTNARKHAAGGRVEVRLRFGEHDVDLAVSDAGGRPVGGSAGEGYGLVGMRERVALYGGTLEAGPQPGGGFGVRARLPLSGGAPR